MNGTLYEALEARRGLSSPLPDVNEIDRVLPYGSKNLTVAEQRLVEQTRELFQRKSVVSDMWIRIVRNYPPFVG